MPFNVEKQINDKALQDYILDALIKSTPRDDIIKAVCEREDIFWTDGEYLVERCERENEALLRKRKSPLLMFVSVVAMAAGAIWALVSFAMIVIPIYDIWKTNGGFFDGVAWAWYFWNFFPQFLAATGMFIGGWFGLRTAMRGMRGLETE